MRQEQHADGVVAGRRQFEAELGRLLGEEFVRRLHQDAGAVAGARIGADGAAMLEIEQDGQRVLDDLVRLAALDVGNKSDPAGIFFQRRIEEAERLRAHRHPRASRPGRMARTRGRADRSSRRSSSGARGRVIHFGGNLRAACRPWLLVLPPSDAPSPSTAGLRASSPTFRPPQVPGREKGRGVRCGPPIGTAMLSYAEHGKLRAPAQVRRCRRAMKSCGLAPFGSDSGNVLPAKWTTGRAQAQGAGAVRSPPRAIFRSSKLCRSVGSRKI